MYRMLGKEFETELEQLKYWLEYQKTIMVMLHGADTGRKYDEMMKLVSHFEKDRTDRLYEY